MASVRLSTRELTRGELPRVCMRCGARARFETVRNFSWHPQWVYLLLLLGLLPCLIAALILTRRQSVPVPLCEKHRGHWAWRAWFAGLGLLFLGLLGGAGLLAAAHESRRGAWATTASGFLCAATGFGFLIYLVLLAILHQVSIRPTEITDRSITLTNVSPRFVEALEEERAV